VTYCQKFADDTYYRFCDEIHFHFSHENERNFSSTFFLSSLWRMNFRCEKYKIYLATHYDFQIFLSHLSQAKKHFPEMKIIS
jgi:hypothetical protein